MVDPHQKKHDKNSKRNVECRSNTQARTRSSSKNEYKKIKKVLHNQDLSSNLLVMFSQLHLVIYPKEFFINKTNGRKIGISNTKSFKFEFIFFLKCILKILQKDLLNISCIFFFNFTFLNE